MISLRKPLLGFSAMFIKPNMRRQLCTTFLARATRDSVANAFGVMLDVRTGGDVNQVAAENVVVDARSELRR